MRLSNIRANTDKIANMPKAGRGLRPAFGRGGFWLGSVSVT